MAQSPGGISKDKRKRTLLEILTRWGKLNFDQISQHMESSLELDVNKARRTLYRDLEELVTEGIISESRFSPDGSPIAEYDQTLNKNTICYWHLANHDHAPSGAGIIETHGGQLVTSQRIKQHIRVNLGSREAQLPNGKISIYFSLGNDFISIEMDQEQLPYTVIFARMPNQTDLPIPFADIEKQFGKRLVLLALAVPAISTLKFPDRIGHCHLTFNSAGSFSIEDQKSTNGTRIANLDPSAAKERIKKTSVTGSSTLTSAYFENLEKQAPWIDLKAKQQEKSNLPALISISTSFQALVF